MRKKLFIVEIVFIISFVFLIGYLIIFIDNYDNKVKVVANKINGLKKDNNVTEEYISSLESEYDEGIANIADLLNIEISSIEKDNILLSIEEDYQEYKDFLEELNQEESELLSKNNSLKEQYEVLYANYLKNNSYLIPNVNPINQYPNYPTGCESVALTILLNYHNINVSTANIVNDLVKGPLPYYENGIKYGGNPYLEFVGNPTHSGSYGTYEVAIMEVANKYKPGIINGNGMSIANIIELIKQDRPVLVWASMYMALPYISNSWIYKPSGETINWIANEHALVVVGYTTSQIAVADPLTGTIKYYNKNIFESRYSSYGKRALYY